MGLASALSTALTGLTAAETQIDVVGNNLANSQTKTHPGGTRKPNPWGLHDMGGNVWELCHDNYQRDLGSAAVTDPVGPAAGSTKIIRGGSWGNKPRVFRSANRSQVGDTYADNRIGFRCVRSL